MKAGARTILKLAGVALALLLVAGVAAPFFTADQFGKRLQASLENALGRKVELGRVRFNLFSGPGFSVDSVTIHEDPRIGLEPIAYVQEPGSLVVMPSIWALLKGKFVIASIRLDGASINLAKTGPAGEPGEWNFASFVNRSFMSTTPALHVRNSRINFKFGDTKSVLYMTETDLDVSPPGSLGGGWKVFCSAKPARTDRAALGLGSFRLRGRWFIAPERVDLDLDFDRAGLGEITALFRGYAGNMHGTTYARVHLGGPISNIGIQGRLNLEDVHRWDLLPQQGQVWPIDIRGRLDLVGQQLEVQSTSASNATPPLSVRFRATKYLTDPHWALAVNWNRFPVEPLMELATHMGAQIPPKLRLSGTMDGAIGYSSEGGMQGEVAFHGAALTIPDSPPVRFEQAYIVLDRDSARLAPTVVKTSDQDQAQIDAAYAIKDEQLDLSISTEAMKVESLRAQVALAAVPWLEQLRSGTWSGELHYRWEQGKAGWAGALQVTEAQVAVPGLADPLQLSSAHATLDGSRLVLDDIEGQAGKISFTGEYRYQPNSPRPHWVRLRAEELDAADLEAELMPTLARSSSLIARAFGRANLPDWMRQRSVEGSIQIDDLLLAGARLQNVRARILWDVSRLELDGVQAMLGRAGVSGKVVANLRAASPSYKITAKVRGLNWQSGKIDLEGLVETHGTGGQLLANMASEGTFSGTAVEFGSLACRTVSGTYNMAPRLRLTAISLRTDDETYTGRGSTLGDGRLMILLNNGSREMRMSGTLAKLKVEETLKQ